MAKRSNNDNDGGKIEFVFVKLEGSNETIQQTVKTIADAIKPSAIIMRPPLPPAEERQVREALENDDVKEITLPPPQPTPRQRSNSKSKNASRPPAPLDLDLTSGEMSFESYVEKKQPKSDAQRYVLIADWLKKYRNISPINRAHIYTCYQVMSWSAPEDLNQVFRSLKNKDFVAREPGQYEITIVGENRIMKMSAPKG